MLKNKERKISYAQAINEALDQSMAEDSNIVIIGEGVPDPKAIFNTTSGLLKKYGELRVFDMPLSENAITGVCIGAALTGLRPVLIHQRLDFALLSMDQLINNAAKWHFMFGGKAQVPLVVRMIIGRGWGQGPQHSQSFQALFAHIPGLKVVMPTTPRDAKGMLVASIRDNNPVIFIEHRWLHYVNDHVPESLFSEDLNKARVIKKGSDLTIIGFSFAVIEVLRVVRNIEKFMNIEIEVIDMRSVRPLDIETVVESLKITGHLIVVDTANKFGSISGELIASIAEIAFDSLKAAPIRLASKDYPAPTSHFMMDNYYVDSIEILESIFYLLKLNKNNDEYLKIFKALKRDSPHDVPNISFQGPF